MWDNQALFAGVCGILLQSILALFVPIVHGIIQLYRQGSAGYYYTVSGPYSMCLETITQCKGWTFKKTNWCNSNLNQVKTKVKTVTIVAFNCFILGPEQKGKTKIDPSLLIKEKFIVICYDMSTKIPMRLRDGWQFYQMTFMSKIYVQLSEIRTEMVPLMGILLFS